MTRVVGYLLVSFAVIGTLVAFLVAEHPDPRASTRDLIREGVLFASNAGGMSAPEEVPEPASERDVLDRFLDRLRERPPGEAAASELEVLGTASDRFRLTLGQALVALVSVGLVGGAMLIFGRRS